MKNKKRSPKLKREASVCSYLPVRVLGDLVLRCCIPLIVASVVLQVQVKLLELVLRVLPQVLVRHRSLSLSLVRRSSPLTFKFVNFFFSLSLFFFFFFLFSEALLFEEERRRRKKKRSTSFSTLFFSEISKISPPQIQMECRKPRVFCVRVLYNNISRKERWGTF